MLTETSIQHVKDVISRDGVDSWWALPLEKLLPAGFDASQYERGMDTMDVWFDSGSSWTMLPNITSPSYNLPLMK